MRKNDLLIETESEITGLLKKRISRVILFGFDLSFFAKIPPEFLVNDPDSESAYLNAVIHGCDNL